MATKAQLRKLTTGLGVLEAGQMAAARASVCPTEAGRLLGWLEAVLVPLTHGPVPPAAAHAFFWGWWESRLVVADVVRSGAVRPAIERLAPELSKAIGRWLLAWLADRADHLWRDLGPPTTAAPGPATGGPPGRRARPRAGLRAG